MYIELCYNPLTSSPQSLQEARLAYEEVSVPESSVVITIHEHSAHMRCSRSFILLHAAHLSACIDLHRSFALRLARAAADVTQIKPLWLSEHDSVACLLENSRLFAPGLKILRYVAKRTSGEY